MEIKNEVIMEKITGLEKFFKDQFRENKEDHEHIKTKLDKTNGDVKLLKEWKSKIEGFIAGSSKSISVIWIIIFFIITMIGTPIINYFVSTKISNQNLNNEIQILKKELSELSKGG